MRLQRTQQGSFTPPEFPESLPAQFQESTPEINSSLRSGVDVKDSCRLLANRGSSFIGVQPNGKGFLIEESQALAWVSLDYRNKKVVKKFSMGGNLAKNINGEPDRWIIDFSDFSLEQASSYESPMDHVRLRVKPDREINREAVLREKWWRFKRTNEALRNAMNGLEFCFAVPRVSKWTTFVPFNAEWLPGDLNVVVTSNDFYLLGVLTSCVHRVWFISQSSTLKGDVRYTPSTCFETFPFPQKPTQTQAQAIRDAAIALHEYRSKQMEQKQWGITTLYNNYFDEPASQLHKLHKKLDKLVLKAYSFKAKDDILEKLLELNQALAAKEKQGETVVGPWDPNQP